MSKGMKIINKSKSTILAEEVIIARGLFKRMRGLLGRKEFKAGQAIILKPCNAIHTFFMCFPIDVLFVTKDNRVIKAISRLKPFRLTYIYWNATFAIELPLGVIQATSTHQDDLLLIE